MEKKEIVANSLLKVLEEAGQKTIVKKLLQQCKKQCYRYNKSYARQLLLGPFNLYE